MDHGVVMFPTEYSIGPDELARALEERGFESVWFPEHTHIPASRKSPWPGGGELPRDYWSAYDPFVALMAAAGATRRLRLGTGICLVIERDPITTAKQVARLDMLSGGRFVFGATYFPQSRDWPGNLLTGLDIREMLKRLGFRLTAYHAIDKVNSLGGQQTAHLFAVQKSDPAQPGFDRVNWL